MDDWVWVNEDSSSLTKVLDEVWKKWRESAFIQAHPEYETSPFQSENPPESS